MKRFFGFVLLVAVVKPGLGDYLKKLQNNHKVRELANSELRFLSNLSDKSHIDDVLDNILIPRVVGTPGHEKVFNYIKNDLEALNWSVEVDEFEDRTPNFGVLTFKNIVAKLNPHADRYLTLACHYDSKYFADQAFVGATDSAVPCAMLLNLARTMQGQLEAIKANQDVSLQLIFFDGEEAFVNWGPKDSIYGARHLVDKLHNLKRQHPVSGQLTSELQKIDMLVLLDLIGHSDVNFYNFFSNTEKWYARLARLEDRLRKLRLLTETRKSVYFNKATHYGRIEDDHVPFLNKGVPILHLISTPFPNEWHTSADNRDIIDLDTTENINKILRAFVAEYLNMLVKN